MTKQNGKNYDTDHTIRKQYSIYSSTNSVLNIAAVAVGCFPPMFYFSLANLDLALPGGGGDEH